jgi:hypothetical protein
MDVTQRIRAVTNGAAEYNLLYSLYAWGADCHMAQALLAAGRGCARLPTAEAAMQFLLTKSPPDARRSAIMRRVLVKGLFILDIIVSMLKTDGPLHATRGGSQTFATILASAPEWAPNQQLLRQLRSLTWCVRGA